MRLKSCQRKGADCISDHHHAKTALRFHDKVEANWQGYRANLLTLSKDDLLEKAEEIAAMKYCRDMLTSRKVSQEARDYLDRFTDPLRVVADAWLAERNGDYSTAFDHVLWELRDRQAAEQEYAMEPGYETGETGQSV